jgi:hypothetical protein
MTKNILYFILIVLFTSSCKKSNPDGGIVIDLSSDIRVVNKQGQNLLDPATQNSLHKENIKTYYLIDGIKTEMYDGRLDYPRQFKIVNVGPQSMKYPNESIFEIFANPKGVPDKNGDEITTTYIEWNNADTDTLVTQIRHAGASIFIKKVWYNGAVTWDITSTPTVEDKTFPGRFFQIVKP